MRAIVGRPVGLCHSVSRCKRKRTGDHSKKSKCYIGIMKNKHIDGYGNCMVVFTDKTPKNLLKVL